MCLKGYHFSSSPHINNSSQPWKQYGNGNRALNWGTSEQQESLSETNAPTSVLEAQEVPRFAENAHDSLKKESNYYFPLLFEVSSTESHAASLLKNRGRGRIGGGQSRGGEPGSREELNLASNKRAGLFIKQQMLIPEIAWHRNGSKLGHYCRKGDSTTGFMIGVLVVFPELSELHVSLSLLLQDASEKQEPPSLSRTLFSS